MIDLKIILRKKNTKIALGKLISILKNRSPRTGRHRMKKIIIFIFLILLGLNNYLYACDSNSLTISDDLKCISSNNFLHIVCPNCGFEFFYVRLAKKPPHEITTLVCSYCGNKLETTKVKEDEVCEKYDNMIEQNEE